MNLNTLLYVIEIERCGSINRAAQNLYLSQSNLSASLKALEGELGYHIFHRTTNGISLTPEGHLFLQSAKAIQIELDRMNRIPDLIDNLDNISLSCTWSSELMQCFISYKENNHPETHDIIKETGLKQSLRDIQERRCRFSLFYCFHSRTAYHQNTLQKINMFVKVIISGIPAVALISRDHPLANRISVSLADLYAYPLVLFEDFEYEDWLYILHAPASQKTLHLFDRGSIIDAVTHGHYISVTMKGAIKNNQTNHLLELPIEDLTDSLDILLLHRKSYDLNEREKDFLNYIHNNFSYTIQKS